LSYGARSGHNYGKFHRGRRNILVKFGTNKKTEQWKLYKESVPFSEIPEIKKTLEDNGWKVKIES
jgi:hypothetical protein